uniref:Uncharacterized protein n=1 Tax=Sphenodon punctatus TaxID=8508 RepID=A0A8D0H3N1_SPHPU
MMKRLKLSLRGQAASEQDGEEAMRKRRRLVNGSERLETAEKARDVIKSQMSKASQQGETSPQDDLSHPRGGESMMDREATVEGGSSGVSGLLLRDQRPLAPSDLNKHPASANPFLPVLAPSSKGHAIPSSPQWRGNGHMSPELDGPWLSDSIKMSLDSPKNGGDNGNQMPADVLSHSGACAPCTNCTRLRAELHDTQEELRLTQASTLYGLSGTCLQDLSEALDTISRILNARSRPQRHTAQNASETPSRAAQRETHLF